MRSGYLDDLFKYYKVAYLNRSFVTGIMSFVNQEKYFIQQSN